VDEASEAIDALDGSGDVADPSEGNRSVEVDTPVRSGPVVVLHELDEDPFEMVPGRR